MFLDSQFLSLVSKPKTKLCTYFNHAWGQVIKKNAHWTGTMGVMHVGRIYRELMVTMDLMLVLGMEGEDLMPRMGFHLELNSNESSTTASEAACNKHIQCSKKKIDLGFKIRTDGADVENDIGIGSTSTVYKIGGSGYNEMLLQLSASSS
ncbi:hypothetical protein C5167_036247 [Papaver somniferum]|nr:hypothetical protein C5167_036247 [Papaver somniferum]